MRIFAATLGTETNTFSPLPTGLKTFEERLLVAAGAHPDAPDLATGPLCAAREYVRAHGGELVEGLCAFATPAGRTVQRVYEELRDRILGELAAAMPVDAVVLGLHGAMVSDDCDDCEGDLLARVRDRVGADVAVGAELDLHCHVSPQMVASADVLITFKEYPHVDFLERGRELVRIVVDTAAGRAKPRIAVYDCRMVATFHTPRQPIRSFVQTMKDREGRDGVLSISAAHGFPWGDVPDMGTKILVVTDANSEPEVEFGAELAAELGRRLYGLREQGTPPLLSIEQAIARALDIAGGPVVLADTSDNAGGGAASDSTFVLAALLAQGVEGAALGPLWDPVAVRIAMEAGVGAKLALRIGGKVGPQSGDPIDLAVTVTGVCPQALQSFGASKSALGDCVCVRGRGVDIVLNSKRSQAFGPELFTNVGIDLQACRIVVVKSSQHFYAGFAPLAREVLYMDGPGSLARDITRLSYRRIRRPMWPFDPDPFAGEGVRSGG